MHTIQVVFYVLAIVLLVLAAIPLPTRNFSLAILGAACALFAFAAPVILAGM